MENSENTEEIDENLYMGLPPLLPNPRWEPDLSLGLLHQTRPVTTHGIQPPLIPFIETPIFPFTPDFSLNETPTFPPRPSSSNVDPYSDPLSSTPALRTHYREDRSPSQQIPMFLIPMEDLMNDGSRAPQVSNRDYLEEYPQLRFQRLLDLNRTGTGPGSVSTHPDTSPERLMNNILALEASRKKLKEMKNGPNGTNGTSDRCKCGADFECNICLETAIEPVVTTCGHLFCWKCLYKWIHTQALSITECPVCKGEVAESNLTPIYGRGGNGSGPVKVSGSIMEEKIPPRPSGRRTDSARQIIRREGTGGGSHEEERVRDLERVLVSLRQVTRANRGTAGTVAIFPGAGSGMEEVGEGEGGGGEGGVGAGTGTGTGTGTGGESGTGSSGRGETHIRRRRRYR